MTFMKSLYATPLLLGFLSSAGCSDKQMTASVDCSAICDKAVSTVGTCAGFNASECNAFCASIRDQAASNCAAQRDDYFNCAINNPSSCDANNGVKVGGDACAAKYLAVVSCASPANPNMDMSVAPKRIFITKATYSGNLGGLQGADQKCQDAATAANLGGTWTAWLSSSTKNAIDRLGDVGPWYLVGGNTKVFDSKAAVTSANPMTAILSYEDGTAVSGTRETWTGTQKNGSVYLDGSNNPVTCADWTSGGMDNSGSMGHVQSTLPEDWTSGGTGRCDQALSLYCFEQ